MWGLNCKFQGGVARSLYASQEAVREREILGVGVFCDTILLAIPSTSQF